MIWLSTSEVIKRYGFNPLPHSDRKSAPDGDFIRSRLSVVHNGCECGVHRYWLEEDLITPAKRASERAATAKELSIQLQYASQYTKGMRK